MSTAFFFLSMVVYCVMHTRPYHIYTVHMYIEQNECIIIWHQCVFSYSPKEFKKAYILYRLYRCIWFRKLGFFSLSIFSSLRASDQPVYMYNKRRLFYRTFSKFYPNEIITVCSRTRGFSLFTDNIL